MENTLEVRCSQIDINNKKYEIFVNHMFLEEHIGASCLSLNFVAVRNFEERVKERLIVLSKVLGTDITWGLNTEKEEISDQQKAHLTKLILTIALEDPEVMCKYTNVAIDAILETLKE